MQLEDFYDYKNQFMGDIITNEAIVRLIDDNTSIEDAASLIYSQVFPYEYIDETVQEGKTFVCVDVDVQKSQQGSTYLFPIIYVWVFTHKSLLRLPNGGGVRTDRLVSEIAKAINGSRQYGLGELDLYAVKRYAPMTDFQGKVMTFYAKEFNRQYNKDKYTPSNRKA